MSRERDPRDHWARWLARGLAFLIVAAILALLVSRCGERISRQGAAWEEQKPRMTQSIPSPPRLSKED